MLLHVPMIGPYDVHKDILYNAPPIFSAVFGGKLKDGRKFSDFAQG